MPGEDFDARGYRDDEMEREYARAREEGRVVTLHVLLDGPRVPNDADLSYAVYEMAWARLVGRKVRPDDGTSYTVTGVVYPPDKEESK